MKITVMGDIHGRTIWKDIVNKESDSDLIIFLGDYVSTHEDISGEDQVSNLYDILNYKESNLDKVILLRGNHDLQHLGYSWAECSNLDKYVMEEMMKIKDRFLSDTQWVYRYDSFLFSHAGVSKIWMKNIKCRSIREINNLEPSPLFGFWPDSPLDYNGSSITQPCTWIRPKFLCKSLIKGYIQIVGHTPVNSCQSIHNDRIYLCDSLGTWLSHYLVISRSHNKEYEFNNSEIIQNFL